ncbi:MAG TPA: iron-containing alcohol dehydrogenase [Syntrophales bacterium]|nr:iron-containing alcohol dehydrogenase [Syntrophales bacterium]
MYLPEHYEFFCHVKINSGHRALEQIPFELDVLNARKPFVISRKGDSERGLIDVIIDAFKDSEVAIGIFDGVPPDPDLKLIRELFNIYRDRGYDAIIAVGGGPVADTAKVLNIAVSGKPDDIEEYAGEDQIKRPLKPLIIVPTLSGTGYEMSKHVFFGGRAYVSHFLMPNLAVIDPRMTITEDAVSIASTTLVALAHAVEAYTGATKNPLADAYAYSAIQLIMEHLVKVLRDQQYGSGRLALSNAHAMAGCAFSNVASGIAHELGKAMGEVCHMPPGLCMGMLLPHVLEKQMSEGSHNIADLLLPLAGFDAYASMTDNLRARRAVDILYDLLKDLSAVSGGAVSRRWKNAQISEDTLQGIAQRAVVNEVISDADGYVKILREATERR